MNHRATAVASAPIGHREAEDASANRRYHVVMLLHELIRDKFKNRAGDTRGYLTLSFDAPEHQILMELLEREAARLRHIHHPGLSPDE